MPVTGLDHYLIRVRDLDRSKDFYAGAPGIEIMLRPEWGGEDYSQMPRVKTTRE